MNSSELREACMEVKKASRVLGNLSESKKNEVLGAVHYALLKESDFIRKGYGTRGIGISSVIIHEGTTYSDCEEDCLHCGRGKTGYDPPGSIGQDYQ